MDVIGQVGPKILELRTSRGLSQEDLAQAIKKSTNTISRWETGTYRPSIEDLEQLAGFFKISVLEFFPKEKREPEDRIMPLLRAAKELSDEDLLELQRYAEYRRARHLLGKRDQRKPGRKRKG